MYVLSRGCNVHLIHCFNLLQLPQIGYSSFSVRIISATPGVPFRGILLQARVVGGGSTPVGTFQDPGTSSGSRLKLLQCTNPGDAITHADANTNTLTPGQVEVTWMPPITNVGGIYFV